MTRMVKMNFNVEADVLARFRRLPDGVRGGILRKIMGMVCDVYEKYGEKGLGALLMGSINVDISRKSAAVLSKKDK